MEKTTLPVFLFKKHGKQIRISQDQSMIDLTSEKIYNCAYTSTPIKPLKGKDGGMLLIPIKIVKNKGFSIIIGIGTPENINLD